MSDAVHIIIGYHWWYHWISLVVSLDIIGGIIGYHWWYHWISLVDLGGYSEACRFRYKASS